MDNTTFSSTSDDLDLAADKFNEVMEALDPSFDNFPGYTREEAFMVKGYFNKVLNLPANVVLLADGNKVALRHRRFHGATDMHKHIQAGIAIGRLIQITEDNENA